MTAQPSLFAPGSIWLGVHDAMSARIARDADVAGLWLSSYGVSASLKACRDASLVTSSEMLSVARQVGRAAASTSVVVDCDTGYGDPTVFANVVREYAETTRVAGLCIEDKVFPKRNSLVAHDPRDLAPVDVLAAKVQAGVRVRTSSRPELRIIARTEALALGAGVDEALARLDRYVQAGADALLVQSTGPEEELFSVADQWKRRSSVPLICVPTSYPHLAASAWWRRGFDVVVRSHQLLQSAVEAQLAVLGQVSSGDAAPDDYADRLTQHGLIDSLVADDEPRSPAT